MANMERRVSFSKMTRTPTGSNLRQDHTIDSTIAEEPFHPPKPTRINSVSLVRTFSHQSTTAPDGEKEEHETHNNDQQRPNFPPRSPSHATQTFRRLSRSFSSNDLEKNLAPSDEPTPSLSAAPSILEDGVPTPVGTCDAGQYASLDPGAPNWPRGWRPWLTLFGCWLLMFNSWGQVNTFGTFSSFYSQHLFRGRDLLDFNLIGAAQCFCILLFSGPVGRLLDAGHAKALVMTGTALSLCANLPIAFVNHNGGLSEGDYPATLILQGFLSGLGMSCFFVTSSQVAAIWFANRKAMAIGIVSTGASCAGLVYPLLVKQLLARTDFKTAVVVYAAAVAGTCGIASAILWIPHPTHIFPKPKKWTDPRVWVDKNAFRDPAFCWVTAGVCWMFFGFYAVFFNLEDWAAYNGFAYKDVPKGLDISLTQEVPHDAIRTYWLLCTLNASSTLGRLGASFFAQRVGALDINFAAAGIGGLLLCSLWVRATTLGPALAFVIIYGIISGAIIGLPPASMTHVLLNKGEDKKVKLGQWTGMMYSVSAPFALTGPIIAGHLVSHYKTYLAVQLWSSFCIIIAACCFLVARYYAGPVGSRLRLRRQSKILTRRLWEIRRKMEMEEKAGEGGTL